MPKPFSIWLDFLRRRQFELVLFLSVSVLIGLAGYGLVRDRIKMVETEHQNALDIAEAVQLHISGELVRATKSILGVRSDLQGNPGASARLVQASLSEAMRYDAVSALVGADHGGEVLMVDRAGYFTNQPAMASALKAAFKTLQTNTVEALPLIHDDEHGIWHLPLALRTAKSGGDADVIFSLVPAEQLVEAAASLQLVTDGRFGLFTGEGKRLFRYLSREHTFEIRPAPVPPSTLRTLEAQQSGTFEGASSIDRQDDIFGYSHSGALPLFVVVGVPKRSLEIAWLQQSAVQLFLLLAGTVASVVFGLRLNKAVLDLKGSHSQYRQLFRSVGDGLVILNRDGVIQKCNPAASRLLRVESEQDLTGVNLAYLKRLPVHILKIDRSFIASLMTEEADRRIVESSIALAHSFNLEVVAEGVETSDVAALLTNMGCDIAQGYFYGRPAGAEDITAQWLLSDSTGAKAGRPATTEV